MASQKKKKKRQSSGLFKEYFTIIFLVILQLFNPFFIFY